MSDLTCRMDVIDLDAYGSPWQLFYRVLERAGPDVLTVFLTDGTPERQRRNGQAGGSKIMSALNGIPRGMTVPASFRLYLPMAKTALLVIGERTGWRIESGLYAFGALQHVCYWGLRLARAGG